MPLLGSTAVPEGAQLAEHSGHQAKEPSTAITALPTQCVFHSDGKTDSRGDSPALGLALKEP